jgi:hypothetical protein
MHAFSSLVQRQVALPRWNRLVAKLEVFLIAAGHANLQFNPWQSQVDIGYQTTSTMKIILLRRRRKIIIEAIN